MRTAGLRKFIQKPPSANGFAFVVIEDGPQLAQLIVAPALWERQARLLQTVPVLVVEGVVERVGHLLTLKAQQLWGLALEWTVAQPEALSAPSTIKARP